MTLSKPIVFSLSLIAIVAAIVLSVANLYLGDLNQDEGWYLYAARLVSQGQWPYVDFAYTQGPVMPLAYAPFQPLIAATGLAGGRLITVALGLLAAWLAARLAGHLAGAELRAGAALTTFILIGVNVYQSYFFAVVKTYALTSLLLLLGFLVLAEALTRRRAWLTLVAGVFMALAAGTRTSAGAVLPIVFLYLWIARRQSPPLAWFLFGIGGVMSSCLIFLPFLISAPESFIYCVMRYHTLRYSGGGIMPLVYKVGFLSRLLQAYFVAFALGLAVVLAKWAASREGAATAPSVPSAASPALLRMLWLSVIAMSLTHFLAPFPYDDYQVFVFPLLAIAVVSAAVRLVGRRGIVWLTIGVLVASLGASASSPIDQDWFIQGRDRIWWLVKDRSPLQKLRDTAALIRQETEAGAEILTQDPYLAVEANLRLPRGLEMGEFCYFPELSDEQAARLHVFNRGGFERLLRETAAPVAALSGYALAIQSPQVIPLTAEDQALFSSIIAERYEPKTNIACFGQAYTTLKIYRKKADR